MLLHKCIAAFYLALFVTIAYPQSFQFTQYTTHNGLPIDNVYAAAQDEYGFMWFGTDFGISKFDGYRFQNYYQQNGMANKAVTDIVYAGGDSCLFVSYPDVIQSIHTNGKINTIAKIESFSIQQLVKHGDEYFFYARGYNKAGVLKRDKVKYFDPESVFNTKGIVIYSIADFDKAGVGFCTNKGLYVLTDKGYRHYLQNEKVDFAVLNDDNTIIAVSNNTVTVAHKNFTFTKTNHILPKQVFVYHMMATKDGAVWFRGINQGIYRLKNDKLEEMSVALNLSSRIVHEFFEDNQNNLWFCTDGSGVLYKRNNAFVIYGTQEGLVNNKINQLMKEGDNIYIGTSLNHGRGITCWEGERLLRNRGFRDIRRVSCHGRYFVYRGWRGGIRSEIHIRQRDGRVVNIRRLNW
jgi:ligand-binding sensor domain-containing protein